MIAKNEYGEWYCLKSTWNCYFTDLEDAMRFIKIRLENFQLYCIKDLKCSSKPIGCKRFNLDGEEIGTLPKLEREMKWLLENGYHVSSIAMTGNNQMVIDIESNSYYPFEIWGLN